MFPHRDQNELNIFEIKNMPNNFHKRITARARFVIPLVAALIVTASFVGCKRADAPANKSVQTPITVKLAQPRRGDITRSVSLPANIIANQQATLYSKVAGYLKTITVDKGDDV